MVLKTEPTSCALSSRVRVPGEPVSAKPWAVEPGGPAAEELPIVNGADSKSVPGEV